VGHLLLAYIIHRCSISHPQVSGLSKLCPQKQEVSRPTTAHCSGRTFSTMGLDIIGAIFPHSSKQHRYILTAADYFTRWTKAVKWANDQEVVTFLQQNIISKFGIPNSLVFDNATYFSSLRIYDFALENGIILKRLANYYPQGNGLVESTNKNLIRIIKKTIFSEQRNWHSALVNALWVDRVTPKPSVNTSPYFLVYGKEAILPPNIYLPYLQLSQESQAKPCLLVQCRMDKI